MSREIQLSTNSPAAADFWTQAGNTAIVQQSPMGPMPPATPQTAPRSPMKKAHRLLRGRYPLAIFLAAAGAAAGAVAGYTSVPPKFQSTGTVLINPMVITENALPNQLTNAAQFEQVEQGLLSSPSVVDAALKQEDFVNAWKAAYGSRSLPTQAEFIAEIDIAHAKGDGLIHASFDDRNKDVAVAGCRSLFHAYMQEHGSIDPIYHQDKILEHDKSVRDALETEKSGYEQRERELAAKYGTDDLTLKVGLLQTQLGNLEENLNATKLALNTAVAAAQSNKKPAPVDMENVYFQIARLDPTMRDLLALRRTADRNMEDAEAQYGAKHVVYQNAARNKLEAHKAVEDEGKKFLATNSELLPQYNDSSEANIAALKDRAAQLQQQFDQAKIASNEVDKQREDLNAVKTKIASTQDRLDVINKKIDDINTQRELSSFVTLADAGSEPVIDDKKRKLAAGVGLMFGGLIPIGLLMLYGLTENRFRYSDDANAEDLSGVTLLGILPNLPDRLSDPQQAGVAAHCVHQIRTMLQISRSNDEPQVIAVTSAAPGDGKTSLTLALGLSYAACGARTLLVDCDLIAAGLTHRLNVSSPDGVLEAVANRALLEYVRTTDIADVAILPVGTTHAHHASTLSPVALRRLLSEAKKQFDIIIVDTGPILGSIEASLVCAASDRTILTVARNQQRPLVERSITHLLSIGANLAGVVFNRAQARDFEKSMNGLALRSRPPAPSGAAAKAVAGSFKRAG
jgi:succinoglycan biosynthesis transport protein ExoP